LWPDYFGHCKGLIAGLWSALGHSRPSRLARKATYDRSCLKADIRRAALRLVVEVEITERLPGCVADDEAFRRAPDAIIAIPAWLPAALGGFE
jgi:hypothetical protein